jgi:hypothetical protein
VRRLQLGATPLFFKTERPPADRRLVVAAPTQLPTAALRRVGLFARVDAAAVFLLTMLVGVSFAIRVAVGWLRVTPNYFTDEYLYAELSRSLVETGRPSVRGVEVDFPALLQPLLTAPAWLADDVVVSYRLIQVLGALAMSLAAVPAFLLARRVGTSRPLALAVAAFTVAIPDLLFASWVVAEPFAYPLVLSAVLAATAAIAQPTRRHAVLFVIAVALAVFARVQFAVLPICFFAALVMVGLRERRLRASLREQALPLAIFGGVGLLAIGVGVTRVLGYYRTSLDGRADPIEVLERIGANTLVLAYSSGWILLPGAVIGLGLAFARPRSRNELAFVAFAVALTGALLLQVGLVGAVEHAQERYVFYVLPLAAVGFCLYAVRRWPARLYLALVAAALIAVSSSFPIAGLAAADGKAHSPLLLGAFSVQQWLGSWGAGSLALAIPAAVLSAVVVTLASRPRLATPVAFALALAACGVMSAAAVAFDQRNSTAVKNAYLPAEPSWVDRAGLSDDVLVRGPNGVRAEALEQLFWNRSVDRVALLPGAEAIDSVRSPRLRVATDGTLLLDGRPLGNPLLVDGYAGTLRLADADRVASSPSSTLWAPHGAARLSLYFAGRYSDGWLAGIGQLRLWPSRRGGTLEGRVRMTLTAPEQSETMTLRFQAIDGARQDVRLLPGVPRSVELEVCSRGPWRVMFVSNSRGFVGDRVVSARSTEPVFVPGSCRSTTAAPTV